MSFRTILSSAARFCLLCSLALSSSNRLVALDIVIVESKTNTGSGIIVTPNPPYLESGATWYAPGSSAKSTAPGCTPGIGSRFGYGLTPAFAVSPILTGSVYSVEVTIPASSASPDMVVNVSAIGGTLSANSTIAFRNTALNTWKLVGYLTNNAGITNPSITFAYASGVSNSTSGRFYADAVRFVNQAEICLTGLGQLNTVNGPLVAGQTFVDVPGVAAGATAVTVYANGIQIGRKSSAIVAGVNRVTTSPLVKDQIIAATQNNASGVESCLSSTGPIVGSGPNPRIRISLSIVQGANATSLSGPIGADGGIPAGRPLKYLGAGGVIGGFGTAPAGGKVFQPSTDWQTVTFLRGSDPANPVAGARQVSVLSWSGNR